MVNDWALLENLCLGVQEPREARWQVQFTLLKGP